MKIVTPKEMRDVESQCRSLGICDSTLLENAGLGIHNSILAEFGAVDALNILTMIGPGNNGTDGLIASKNLADMGANVTVLLFTPRPDTDAWLCSAQESGVDVIIMDKTNKTYMTLKDIISSTHLLIDAVLGTGVSRRLSEPFTNYLAFIQGLLTNEVQVVAVDLPTGLDPGTGFVDPSTIIPDLTMALGFPKIGHVTYPGSISCGNLRIVDIGIPDGIVSEVKTNLIRSQEMKSLIPKRPPNANKGTFGRTMVVGGSDNYRGAPGLAAAAALRVGAGLVTCSIPRSIAESVNKQVPECTLLPLEDTEYEIKDGWRSARLVYESLETYSSMVIGCGLGLSRQTRILVDSLILSASDLPPLVIDADALNVLSGFSKWWDRLHNRTILTPHPREMSRLTGLSTQYIQSNRLEIARTFAQKWHKFIVLKGANTVIATPEGVTWVNDSSNPALASAGTGDVLAGIIAGLIAQGVSLEGASVLGVYLHSVAGFTISERNGYPISLATDIIYELPHVLGTIKKNG